MRTLYLVSKCLPRVCMGGSHRDQIVKVVPASAPRVHGWFQERGRVPGAANVCPACAWVVPPTSGAQAGLPSLPRVCMGGSLSCMGLTRNCRSAPRVHGWFLINKDTNQNHIVCPACAWVVPTGTKSSRSFLRLPRVCMGGSLFSENPVKLSESAPRVHGWFHGNS